MSEKLPGPLDVQPPRDEILSEVSKFIKEHPPPCSIPMGASMFWLLKGMIPTPIERELIEDQLSRAGWKFSRNKRKWRIEPDWDLATLQHFEGHKNA